MRMINQTAHRNRASAGAAMQIAPKASANQPALRVYKKYLPNVQKRDGRIVPFEFDKIVSAIHKAMQATNEGSEGGV